MIRLDEWRCVPDGDLMELMELMMDGWMDWMDGYVRLT